MPIELKSGSRLRAAALARAGVNQINHRDLLLGAIFALIGAGFVIASRGLELGTAQRMGPGFFPLLLASVLVLLGVAIAAQLFFTVEQPLGQVPWRGLVLILAAPVLFGITVRGLGLVGAVALAVATSTFASRRAGLMLGGFLTLGLTIFCVLVFSYGLGLPIPLRGPWLWF
jgi:Tripartite tricarboxylate transporter TctB family